MISLISMHENCFAVFILFECLESAFRATDHVNMN